MGQLHLTGPARPKPGGGWARAGLLYSWPLVSLALDGRPRGPISSSKWWVGADERQTLAHQALAQANPCYLRVSRTLLGRWASAFRDRGEAVGQLAFDIYIEHLPHHDRPTVDEVAPAVLDTQTARLRLRPSLT